jgi:hemoglobin/transferrin/lactoferrin receptor protein
MSDWLRVAGARSRVSSYHLVGISALALLCAMAAPARAEELTDKQTTILKRIVVTATRTETAILDVAQNVTVIGSQEIEDRMVRDIQDLVRYEPGVDVGRTTSLTNPFGQLTGFSIRGVSGNRVQMLVDGSRVQEQAQDGSRDFVDPWNMKSIEIVRGPGSVLWGADALGGAVAFRTRDPSDLLDGEDKPWAVELRTGWDSYDNSLRQQITGAYDFGDVQVLASFGHLGAEQPKLTKGDPDGGIWGCTRPDYFRCNALLPQETTAYNGLAKLVHTPSADHEFRVTGEFFSRGTDVDQIWDSQAENPAYAGYPTYFYTSESYLRHLDMARTRVAVEHDWTVGSDWLDKLSWKLAVTPQRRDMHSVQERTYPLQPITQFETREQIRNYAESFLEADVQLTSSFDLAQTFHTLTYGFDGDIAHTTYEGTDYIDNHTTGVSTIKPHQGFNFAQSVTQRADFYIQDEIKLLDERLTVTPGLRVANYRIDPTQDASYVPLPGFEPRIIESTRLIKKLGVTYQFNDAIKIYAGYGEGFKMPTAQQLFVSSVDIYTLSNIIPNPNLRPEEVENYEIGLRGEFDRGYFSVNGFYSKYKNFIRSLQPVEGQVGYYTYDNVESATLWGIEAKAEYEVLDNLFLSGALTYSQGVQQVSAGAPETVFDSAIPLTVVAGVRYEIPEHALELELIGTFAAGPTGRSTPDAFLPDGYAVFDAYAKWTPKENVELTAGIQNIFDVRYFPNTLTGFNKTPASPAYAATTPLEAAVAPGRTLKVGAKVKF